MKRIVFASFFAAMPLCAQSVDLSSLDKLAAKASSVAQINLDQNQLRMALQMMPSDKDKAKDAGVKNLLSGLTSIQVRNLEFAQRGAYNQSDLDPIFAQVAKLKGSKIIDSKEKDERSEIYMLTDGNKPTGLAIVSAEPKEISVVIIQGSINLSDLGELKGVMGLPTMRIGPVDTAKSDH